MRERGSGSFQPTLTPVHKCWMCKYPTHIDYRKVICKCFVHTLLVAAPNWQKSTVTLGLNQGVELMTVRQSEVGGSGNQKEPFWILVLRHTCHSNSLCRKCDVFILRFSLLVKCTVSFSVEKKPKRVGHANFLNVFFIPIKWKTSNFSCGTLQVKS